MDEQQLWQVFSTTGRVEDYLRYRGVTLSSPMGAVNGEGADGTDKTASYDRWSGRAGIPDRGGV